VCAAAAGGSCCTRTQAAVSSGVQAAQCFQRSCSELILWRCSLAEAANSSTPRERLLVLIYAARGCCRGCASFYVNSVLLIASTPHPPPTQALVDAPGITRHVETFKRLTLTDFKVEIPRLASKKVLTAAWTEAGELFDGAECRWGSAQRATSRRRGSSLRSSSFQAASCTDDVVGAAERAQQGRDQAQ